jgi:bifunctional DNA-binding transcriptional regulator/antitoxin component of YhaV-PrlF toxin-antitoxin module
MTATTFRLPIGNKCQVTIPKKCMALLSLDVGDDLLLEVKGDHAILHPAVSIPRRELPEELWKKFEARRGPKPTDIPLKTLLKEIGYRPKVKGRNGHPAQASAARGKASGGSRTRVRTGGAIPAAAAESGA